MRRLEWEPSKLHIINIADEPVGCVKDCTDLKEETKESSESYTIPITVTMGILAIVLVSAIIVRNRSKEEDIETWHDEETVPVRDDRIPEGWTLEEFLNWLDGPMPEDWQEDQWELYKLSLDDLR